MTRRLTVGFDGSEPDSESYTADLSPNGRYVAFSSSASNLLPDPEFEPGSGQAYLFDRRGGSLEVVSVSSRERPASGGASAVTPDGRYVTFDSWDSSLPGGDDSLADVFVRDREAGTTTRVSVDSQGEPVRPGRPPGGGCGSSDISASGRYVLMECDVSLVPGDRYGTDIYLRDRVARTTRLVSVSDHGWSVHEGTDASISADGRYVCFTAMAVQLSRRDHNFRSDVYVRDRRTRETLLISEGAGGKRAQFGRFGVISDNGRFVAFNTPAALVPGDTNNLSDVYVRDLETWGVVRASLSDADQQTLGAGSRIPQISANGRFVTFRSAAPGLAPGDTRRVEDVFIRDLTERTTRRVSMSINGGAGNAISFTGPVSANGRVVTFTSYASNLVADDLAPSELDVFLWRRR